jgi:hypothetical protein
MPSISKGGDGFAELSICSRSAENCRQTTHAVKKIITKQIQEFISMYIVIWNDILKY